MARSRNIKPSIMSNEELAELSTEHRLLFIYLWMLADREGRLEDRPKRIGAQAFPYDKIDAAQILIDLEQSGFIERYEADGVNVINIINFLKHQSPHGTERDSALPDKSGTYKRHTRGRNGYATGKALLTSRDGEVKEQSDNSDLTVKKPLDDSSRTVNEHPDSPNHDSLIPDSLIPDSNLHPLPFHGVIDDLPEPHELPRPSAPLGNGHPRAGDACLAIKQTGIGYPNPADPRLNALLHAGVTIEQIADACVKALKRNKNIGYALSIAASEAEEARSMTERLGDKPEQGPSRYSPEAYKNTPPVSTL